LTLAAPSLKISKKHDAKSNKSGYNKNSNCLFIAVIAGSGFLALRLTHIK